MSNKEEDGRHQIDRIQGKIGPYPWTASDIYNWTDCKSSQDQLLEPPDPMSLLQSNLRQGGNINQKPQALDPENYPEPMKAIFNEDRRAGGAKEAEQNMDISLPEDNDIERTPYLGACYQEFTTSSIGPLVAQVGQKHPKFPAKTTNQKVPNHRSHGQPKQSRPPV